MFSERIFRELQKSIGGRISSCNVRDANIDGSFQLRLRFQRKHLTTEILANNSALCVRTRAELPIRQLSVNKREATGFPSIPAGTVSIQSWSFPVFTSNGKISDTEWSILRSKPFTDLICNTGLNEIESLHLYRNGISGYFFAATSERVLTAVDSLINLTCAFSTPAESSTLDLPAQFRPLVPLIQKWAIHDDEERGELLRDTPGIVLRTLIEEVKPYLSAIDSYLDSFSKSPPTESAVALGRIAECALEAEAEMKKRSQS
jgi:hypothetical protein